MIEYVFMAAGAITLVRALRGKTFADRVMAVGSLVNIVVVLMVMQAVLIGEPVYLDTALVLITLSFVGTLAVAKYLTPREDL